MKWINVRLIFLREVRDQLRDRRTLFMIAVLPLLLYPLLGMTLLEISQFLKEHRTRVWLIGEAALPAEPPLVAVDADGKAAFEKQFCPASEAALIDLVAAKSLPPSVTSAAELNALAQREMKAGKYDVVVFFPQDFADKLAEFQDELHPAEGAGGQDGLRGDGPHAANHTLETIDVPRPRIFVNSASEKSRIAKKRIDDVLKRWRERIVQSNLERSSVPVAATRPFQVVDTDVAEDEMRRAAVWSKILPFVVLIWALTGAFYPAVDLCAGEKERGTLETLLSSPAQRSEIVWGKLLTIMLFSMTTSILNLLCMGLTGAFIIHRLGGAGMTGSGINIGPPPLETMGWLVLALVPISALFSALTLAIAAFARSTKEGQYYLMPLLLITLPLMMLPMFPGAQLDLGMSLIPVTGLMLLLRSLMEGQYADALRYTLPVTGVTLACCLAAIRWAVDQFNNESVLFRESERWGLGLWLRHLVRDRPETPGVGAALLCGVLLLVLRFFVGLTAGTPHSWREFAASTLVTQLALIATPALLMAIVLTRNRRRTLLLTLPHPLAVPMAVLLAIALNPAVHLLGWAVKALYPMSPGTLEGLEPLEQAIAGAPLRMALLVLAVAPAVCEELAFRGFILSGLRHMGHKWAAIGLTAVLFGMAHFMLQQSITACAIGVVIGYIAVQTGSLWPCIAYHMTHNGLNVLASRLTPELIHKYPVLGWLVSLPSHSGADAASESLEFHWPVVLIASLTAVAVLYWFRCIPWKRTEEEQLREALDHQTLPAAAR